jgi:hypothetical protein
MWGVIYEVHSSDGLRCHEIHTTSHKYWFRHSQLNRGSLTDTQQGDIISLLLFFQNKENKLKSVRIFSLGEGEVSVCLIKLYAMKTCGGVEV